jgi:rRNA-processing protein FCF1
MKIISKFILITAIAVFAVGLSAAVLAESTTGTSSTDEVSAQDLGVSDPILLPNNPFYFLKEWGRGIQSFFAFGSLKKAELEQKFANERLIELRKLVEEGKISSEILTKAADKYKKTMEKIKDAVDKGDGNVNKFLDKFANQQILHEKILQKLETQVPEQVIEKIQEARDQHLENFKDVMIKLEDNSDKIVEKIQNAVTDSSTDGSEAYDVLIIEKIGEKMPLEIKDKLDDVKTIIIDKGVDNEIKKNNDGGCPIVEKPSPDFCSSSDGTGVIKTRKDDKGCIIKFDCLIIPTLYIPSQILQSECKTDSDCPELCPSCGIPDGSPEYQRCLDACVEQTCVNGACVAE